MAEKRMFAKTIIDSDTFLDMPLSTQALYFHLSMRADDDGFINNPKKIQRMIGCSDDDLKLLIAKNFIIPFESGIVVIKHWRIHNYIRADRYKPTVYVDEKSMLVAGENREYSLGMSLGIPDDNQMDTQYRLDKSRVDKISIEESNKSSNEDYICPSSSDTSKKANTVYANVVTLWNTLESCGIKPIRSITAESKRHVYLRARFKEFGEESFEEVVENIRTSDFLQGKTYSKKPFVVTFDWVVLPSNYVKVLEGNYNNRNVEPKPKFYMPTGLEKPKDDWQ